MEMFTSHIFCSGESETSCREGLWRVLRDAVVAAARSGSQHWGWLTLAASDMESQFPPERAYFPQPILARISSGVSSGPFANGVNLRSERVEGSEPPSWAPRQVYTRCATGCSLPSVSKPRLMARLRGRSSLSQSQGSGVRGGGRAAQGTRIGGKAWMLCHGCLRTC
jgi:hypothetical protein